MSNTMQIACYRKKLQTVAICCLKSSAFASVSVCELCSVVSLFCVSLRFCYNR